jgi:uncharacterized protein YdaU (DUF1376 family)
MHSIYLNIGDYLRDAGHLNFHEHGAYFALIREYYSSESALPLDHAVLHRITRCRTPQDRKALDSMINEFFTKESDGYHHKRCDEEIAKYREKSAKAKTSAEHRWNGSKHANA